MSILIIKPNKPASKKELIEVEMIFDKKLPDDYQAFLLKNNGGVPETNEFDIEKERNSSGVNQFLSTKEIIAKKNEMADRFVKEAIPIAYTEGGNYVCLVAGDMSGIYYWDHEFEETEGNIPTWKNMFLISKSFSEFYKLIKKFDPSKVELKPGQVKNAWIDPDFLKSIKK